MTSPALPPRARTTGVVAASVLAAMLLLAVSALAWVGVRGAIAYSHLSDAQTALAPMMASLDSDTAPDTIAAITQDTAAARDLTSDPVWRAVEGIPWIGPQLAAVSTVAAAVDDVAKGALTPLAGELSAFSAGAMTPIDGRIDTSVFVAIQADAQNAASSVTAAATAVDALDESVLVGPLRNAVTEVGTLLHQASMGSEALSRAATLLPRMLGADGPRDYLVLFQNNAEWRSLGGIVGAMALIHTDAGAMSLVAQDSASAFPRYDGSVLPLEPEIEAIYGQRPGTWFQNVTQIPDFAVTAPLAREMWARKHGQQVDGVISMDPVALSYLLAATGPLTLPTGDVLTSDKAVQLLLNDVYLRYTDPSLQDAFFAAAAASVFDALSRGAADPSALLSALSRAGDERRLLLWSADPADQAVLADTTLAGGLPVTDADAATFGVYVNDGTGSKMDYYASATAEAVWDSCTLSSSGQATGDATLNVTIANLAPADAASLPRYITGGGAFGVPIGTARTTGYLYLPEGFELTASSITGDSGFGGGFHDGRRVISFSVDLAPGTSAVATLTARTTAPSASRLAITTTPTLNETVTRPAAAECNAR